MAAATQAARISPETPPIAHVARRRIALPPPSGTRGFEGPEDLPDFARYGP